MKLKFGKKVIKVEKQHELLLTVLFIVYILFDVHLPKVLAEMVDTLTGNIVIAMFALSLLVFTNPILGILGIAVAFIMIHRASKTTGSYAKKHYLSSEKSKGQDFIKFNEATEFSKYNDYPATLEEEMVERMAPLSDPLPDDSKSTYKPMKEMDHRAAPIDYDGVV